MTIFLPNMGFTSPFRALNMMETLPKHFVGSFLIPGGYGFAEYSAPSDWISTVNGYTQDPDNKDTSCEELLSVINNGWVAPNGHDSGDGMYLQLWIGILAEPSLPTSLSYVIEHVRTHEIAMLLEAQMKIDAPAHTEVMDFRYYKRHLEEENSDLGKVPVDLGVWSLAMWEHFCATNMAQHGDQMYQRWLNRTQV